MFDSICSVPGVDGLPVDDSTIVDGNDGSNGNKNGGDPKNNLNGDAANNAATMDGGGEGSKTGRKLPSRDQKHPTNVDMAGLRKAMPVDVQDAVVNLIELCEESKIDIPETIAESLKSAVSESNKQKIDTSLKSSNASGNQFQSSTKSRLSDFSTKVVEERKTVLENFSIAKHPIIVRQKQLQSELQLEIPKLALRVKDGYFKYIETLNGSGGDVSDEEELAKQRIVTVWNGAPVMSLWSKMKRILSGQGAGATKIDHYPVKNINLNFEQGKTYLVLGAPRSGKSSLLRMIAGILPEDKEHVVGGDVICNRIDQKNKKFVWSNLVGYIDQIDRLHPYLTVKETFNFAWRCRTGGTHRTSLTGAGPAIEKKIKELNEEEYKVMLTLDGLGLTRVKDTFVGDQQTVRGVSGGEKKRVTVGEMSVGFTPVLCMDEISTGLDAATTYDICKLLGESNRLQGNVRIVSLLQPPPETFALFDELIVLSAGKVIYSGPVEDVVPHFESLGYELPERMDVADWLQALPTKDGVNYLRGATKNGDRMDVVDEECPSERKHLTADEFHERFYESEQGKKILQLVKGDIVKLNPGLDKNEAVMKWVSTRFANSTLASMKLLISRECLLWWRDKVGIKTRIAQDLIMGIIAGTLFWQQGDVTTSIVGILFQSMMFITLGAMMKVAPQYAVRGILYKQQDANFFPTWTYVFGRSLATIPASVVDGLLYGTIVYWFVGLAYNDGASAWNYITFVFVILFSSVGVGLLFSIFSAITKDRSSGQAFMSVSMVLLLLFSGFTVTPSVIPDYWIWVYWINPFAWAFRGLIVNQFDSGKYDYPSQFSGMSEGELILSQLGYVDRDGNAYTIAWAGWSIIFSIAISVCSVVVASICLVKVRFATGKSLANSNIEKNEDKNTDIVKVETALPFQKVRLAFRDIRYTVISSIGKEKIELLKGIDGVVEPGKMTALMGSSGAGKTTLMDVLALRKTSGEIVGDVLLNGHPQEEKTFRRCTGYVEQFDVQSAALTIRETCEFSAKLRLESTDPLVTPESTERFIDQTLDMLELTPIQNFQVGNDSMGGLSFEQKKRLSIAVELVSNPSILFLDEPTSGLDARAAAIVMRGLKRIALTGRAVCATIHQPSISIFNSFDTLLLLKRGGEVVYFGDLGENSCNLIEYLESYESTPPIQPGENPATWMLTTIGAGNAATGDQFDYAHSYKDSKLHNECKAKIKSIEESVSDDGLISFPSQFATPRSTQIKEVLKRSWKVYWRSPTYNRTRILVAAILSLLIGSVFVSNRVPSNEAEMNSRVTTVYLSFLIIAVNGQNTVLAFFEAERNMYYRHKAALMYNTSAISFAFTCAEIPFLVGSCFLYTTIFYFMVGFDPDAAKYFWYYFFMLLNMSCFTYIGHMFVALSPDAQVAQGFGGLLISITSLFTGVLIRPENIPSFWRFLYWLLPGHYILEGLLVTQFNGDETPIVANPGSPFWISLGCDSETSLETIPNATLTEETTTNISECVGTADQWVTSSFGDIFTPDHIPLCVGYLVALLVLTRIITLVALEKLNYRRT